jgi:acetyltransferase-like isoleucine patch superfamily enzyme
MADLRRKDWALWNVEKAREIGVKVGNNCRFYSLNVFSEPYLLEVGDDVIISGEVIFTTHDGGIYLLKDEIPNIRGYYGRIKIGNNCFVGMGAIILPNVSIGDNCIVGAGSVVAQSIPANSVIMGNPAKVIFKTDLYRKMRKHSKNTILCSEYPFPKRIPDKLKKELLIIKSNIPAPNPPRVKK